MMKLDLLSVRLTLRAVQAGVNVQEALQLCEWSLDGSDCEESLQRFLLLAVEARDDHSSIAICAPQGNAHAREEE